MLGNFFPVLNCLPMEHWKSSQLECSQMVWLGAPMGTSKVFLTRYTKSRANVERDGLVFFEFAPDEA